MIKNATKKLTEGRTSLIIAHRLSTIQQANKIVVIEKGEIVEQGKHEHLIEQRGYYSRLHDIQFVNQNNKI